MSEDQPWRRRDLGNPLYAFLLALLFEWGVAVHDLEVERIEAGEITLADKRDILRAIWRKGRRQVLKDYVAFPLLAGPGAPFTLRRQSDSANLARNVWAFMIIFCGHFPEGVEEFSEEEVEHETRGAWYLRQMLGSANLTGSRLFHILSGNLSHQIEHHLFPDIPAHRYAEIARRGQADLPAVRAERTTPARWQTVRFGREEDRAARAPAEGSRSRVPEQHARGDDQRAAERDLHQADPQRDVQKALAYQ